MVCRKKAGVKAPADSPRRAVPAEISELAGIENWGQNEKWRKSVGSKFEKSHDKGYISEGVTGVRAYIYDN